MTPDVTATLRETLNAVLVPAGFSAAQGGYVPEGESQLIFCAAHDEFSARFPQLPQAGAQASNSGACIDLVVRLGVKSISRIDLEGQPLAETLRVVGLLDEAEPIRELQRLSLTEAALPLAEALRALFAEAPSA